MNVKMEIIRNIITVDDTAAASGLPVLCMYMGFDSGIVSTNKKHDNLIQCYVIAPSPYMDNSRNNMTTINSIII